MKIVTHRWIQQGAGDIGRYKTTVTITDGSLTAAVTLCGKFARKEAIRRTYLHLNAENRWSRSFLNAIADTR